MSSNTIHIAIVGGGIAGLSFAIALSKTGANVDVDIYESTASFGEVGAGIVFFPRILDDLRLLGFGADLEANGMKDVQVFYRKGDESDCPVWGGSTAPMQGLRRAKFLDTLLKQLPATYRAHFGKRLASYTDSAPDPVVLSFEDGTTATCDVLVGADGLKSATRKVMFEKLADAEPVAEKANALRECIEPKWAGQYIYKNLISGEKLAEISPGNPALEAPTMFTGKRKYIVAYPISHGNLINISAVVQHTENIDTFHDKPWASTVPLAEVKEAFAGWSPYVQDVLDCVAKPSRWVLNYVPELPTFVSGRVAIIGDAAHAMTPHLGSGAGQGIEDGVLLATLLAQPPTGIAQIPTVLEVFDEVRRPFAQDICRKSFQAGMQNMLCDGELKKYSAEESAAGKIPAELLKRIEENFAVEGKWTYTTFAKDDREKAVELYQARTKAQ